MAWRVKTPSPMYAAITPTAGDVLFTGNLEGNFLVLNARNGREIYRFDTGGPLAGGIVTWEQQGHQYIAVASGHSGGSIQLRAARRSSCSRISEVDAHSSRRTITS